MAKNSIFQVIIVFLMVQVCLLMMMAAPTAHAAARPVGYNPVCCPRNIYCCGFGGALANSPMPSIEP
uniref:Transmembrane protein n=1 Tax=Aegilops tauschii subsp. strangulata TaxID=200361 RepID=A0A453QMP5_AEGTS